MSRPDVESAFEDWAEVAARVRVRPAAEQQAILRDLGIGAEWRAIHASWAKSLNEDIEAGRMDRPKRYLQACRQELERRKREASLAASQPPPVSQHAPWTDSSSMPPPPMSQQPAQASTSWLPPSMQGPSSLRSPGQAPGAPWGWTSLLRKGKK